MKKILTIIITILLAFSLVACDKDKTQEDGKTSDQPAETGSNSDSGDEEPSGDTTGLISFDDSDSNKSTYKEHVADLWEQTKTAMQEDLAAGYSDEEYQDIGSAFEIVWTNLQVHASLDHKEEADAADEDTAYANLIGHIKDLINKAYGNWGAGTVEEREEKRESLRDGGLERKFEDLDEVVYSEA